MVVVAEGVDALLGAGDFDPAEGVGGGDGGAFEVDEVVVVVAAVDDFGFGAGDEAVGVAGLFAAVVPVVALAVVVVVVVVEEGTAGLRAGVGVEGVEEEEGVDEDFFAPVVVDEGGGVAVVVGAFEPVALAG